MLPECEWAAWEWNIRPVLHHLHPLKTKRQKDIWFLQIFPCKCIGKLCFRKKTAYSCKCFLANVYGKLFSAENNIWYQFPTNVCGKTFDSRKCFLANVYGKLCFRKTVDNNFPQIFVEKHLIPANVSPAASTDLSPSSSLFAASCPLIIFSCPLITLGRFDSCNQNAHSTRSNTPPRQTPNHLDAQVVTLVFSLVN